MLAVLIVMQAAAMLRQPAVAATTPAPYSSGKEHPVAKIVALLQKMQDQLTTDQKKDEEVHEALSCWCTTNNKEKTAALAAAEKAIDEYTSAIEEGTAKSAKLQNEIAQLKDEREQAKAAIETAEGMRADERAAFEAEHNDLLATIDALARAIESLSKHHESFLSVNTELQKLPLMAKALSSPKLRQRVEVLLQQPNSKSYNSRSGEIFGILQQMKEDFEKSAAAALAEEERAQQEFNELVKTKEESIAESTARILRKTAQLTETNVLVEQAKHDLKDTREQLTADQAFLIDLAKRCEDGDAEYAERVKSRQEELVGVGEALKILTDDSSRDLFSSSLGFFQVSAESDVRSRAVAVLKAAAAKSGSVAVQRLAASAGIAAFTKVKAEIDTMIAQLKTDAKDEITHQRWCSDEIRKNEVSHKDESWALEDHTANFNKLADAIETLDSEIAGLRESVAEAERQIKRASEDREAANKVFQQSVADQRGTEAVLKKVLVRLQQVYAPDALVTPAPAALVQRADPHVRDAPEGFSAEGGQKQSAGGVLGMIEMTIADAQRLQKETIAAEQEQQTDYVKLVKDAADGIHADRASVNDKSSARADTESAKVQAEQDLEATNAAIAALEKFSTEVHASCDFVLNNFELRQSSRAQEIDSLEQAKAILSGAGFGGPEPAAE